MGDKIKIKSGTWVQQASTRAFIYYEGRVARHLNAPHLWPPGAAAS
jgi:hypothetical protein